MKHPLLFLLCAFGQWCHSLGLVPRSWDFRSYLGTLGLFARTLGLFLGTFFEKFKWDFLAFSSFFIIFHGIFENFHQNGCQIADLRRKGAKKRLLPVLED